MELSMESGWQGLLIPLQKLKTTFDRFCWKSLRAHPSPSISQAEHTAAGLGMGVCLGVGDKKCFATWR